MSGTLKRLVCLLLALTMSLTCFAAFAESADVPVLDMDGMWDFMLSEFLEIAKVPRGSSHTEKISAYLYQWGLDHGFEAEQDAVGNVRYEVPATPGYEDVPLVIMQGHMDMVAVSDDGRDMLESPITVIVDMENNKMSSDGHTSLGADDGMGIVSAMYLITSEEVVHGPLRVIFTINEEGGSPSGTGNMDHGWVTDGKYLVNIDSEDYATCTVAACGFNSYSYRIPLVSEAPAAGKAAYKISLTGAKGGHSGVDIEKNRSNSIKAVNYCLAWAKYLGIDVQVASFTGGTGGTAIPALANAVIVFSPEYEEKFATEMERILELYAQQYDRTEAGYSFTFTPADMPEKVLTAECSATVIDFVAAVEDGINTISQRYPGITETSFNLGTLNVDAQRDTTSLSVSMRCSTRWPVMLANMQFLALGNAFGVDLVLRSENALDPSRIGVGWEEREGDIIAQLYKDAFDRFTGDECEITAVHGGLECADFASWSDTIEIISVGPTVESPHSIGEYVEIDTVTKTCGAIATLLKDIAEGKGM